MKIRIGFGYDVHPLVMNYNLWLGGIKIPYEKGLKGHSDADVLIHALCDALLGAADIGNIGTNFPNTNKKLRNIDSKILLKQTMSFIYSKNYELNNADITVCIEQPKLNPFIPQMKTCLAEIMQTDKGNISIKATTSEKMGFIGREEGIAVFATVLITNTNK
ncbi:MAG: 2-C-methyl-D-erythritol 2,4-cyclodiphosphate synthase [Candidatus Azobacteroides pseudotrichonymphae]|jgi:2-C-methyl-D-erythritol 2,4-cyclodiphosphate synthase|nr:MAG: 2-C-methyl-D-erythritol 2,4-cyclodiphosphate synthase [Candidatus Azobacteroides pseudotrichonymphae]